MKYSVILLTVFLIYFPGIFAAPNGNNNSFGIVGGFIAKEGQFPYQVIIYWIHDPVKIYKLFCGGSIYNKQYIITSADCGKTIQDKSEFRVGAGANNITGFKHMIVKEIESIIAHEYYDFDTGKNDISLIKIKGEFTFSDTLKPIALNTEHIPEGTNCTISGWGSSTPWPMSYDARLQGAYVTISNQTQCVANHTMFRVHVDKMVCAGVPGVEVGPCDGDSGIPLVCNNKLTGIAFWITGCGKPYVPAIYTRIDRFINWIETYAGESHAFVRNV